MSCFAGLLLTECLKVILLEAMQDRCGTEELRCAMMQGVKKHMNSSQDFMSSPIERCLRTSQSVQPEV